MKENSKFWDSFNSWENFAPKTIEWNNDWLKNGFCKECKLCCGPQGNDAPFPMALLPEQLTTDIEQKFYLLSPTVAYIGKEGCKSDSTSGCKLGIREKPVACNLFPVVIINGGLYLYQNCPAVLLLPLALFMNLGKKIANYLQKFTLDELMQLSINVDYKELAEKYIDLHIKIFNEQGKKLIFE